ncbi:hypothetical protein AX16_000007 [Volvariella volvacea WC 439]|nr:hypothetical protein AX16_000007 [Volvariella volvacea WC 439]
MASISFPSSTETSNTHESQFFGDGYDPSSSFQMNPLSSHPPRTPKPSTSGPRANGYSTTYEVKVDTSEDEREADDTEQESNDSTNTDVRKEDVWREMFLTSNGRDKAFKLMQYTLRVYLLFHNAIFLRRLQRPAWETDFRKRLQSTVSGLSLSRKTLLLFNWLGPLTTIMAKQSVPFSSEQREMSKQPKQPFLHALLYAPPPVLLEFANAIADDTATFAKLGLLGKRTGEKAGRFADWCWLLSTIVGLVENALERQINYGLQSEVENRVYSQSMTGMTEKSKSRASKVDEKELAKLQKRDFWLQVTRAKLLMDLIFVTYDVFDIRKFSEPVKAFTGLAAAILSSAKLYDRHKAMLLKSIS